MLTVNYTLSPNPTKRFQSQSESLIFGRNPRPGQQVDLDLRPDGYVSHMHARLFRDANEYWIEDLNSENGTWVNGKKIDSKVKLVQGDTIRIGWTIIELEFEELHPIMDSGGIKAQEKTIVSENLFDTPIKTDAPIQIRGSGNEVSEFDETVVRKEASNKGEQLTDDLPSVFPEDKKESLESEETIIRDISDTSESGEVREGLIDQFNSTHKMSMLEQTAVKDLDKKIESLDTGDEQKSQSIPLPEKEHTPQGSITTIADATLPPFTKPATPSSDDTQKQIWLHLKALNDFTQALGPDVTLDNLGQIIVEQLRHAIPSAQRGAVLLQDEKKELLLKAHWPPGKHSVSMTWVKRAFTRQEAFIWSAEEPNADVDNVDDAPKSAIYYDVQSAIYIPLLAAGEVLGVMYVDNYFTREAFSDTDFELLRAIANQIALFLNENVLRKDLKKEELLRSNLLCQYSPKIAERILEKSVKLQRGGEQVDPVTILMSDVRGFTVMSSRLSPDEVVRSLNEMFDAFVPIISEFNGIVDKFVGDAILAVFGSPEYDPNQWENAVKAGLKMQRAMHMIGESRKIRRLPVFDVGIGIHSGQVIHGFIGSSERIEYTVIGDAVNQAARYCDGAKAGELVISKPVFERIYHMVDVRSKRIKTKHSDVEPDLEAYIVDSIKGEGI